VSKTKTKVIKRNDLSKETQANLDLVNLNKLFQNFRIHSRSPEHSDKRKETMKGVNAIREIIENLNKEYGTNWDGLDKLFKLQTHIKSLHEKFMYNYRLNAQIAKLNEIIKVKIDKKWTEKTEKSPRKILTKLNIAKSSKDLHKSFIVDSEKIHKFAQNSKNEINKTIKEESSTLNHKSRSPSSNSRSIYRSKVGSRNKQRGHLISQYEVRGSIEHKEDNREDRIRPMLIPETKECNLETKNSDKV
jgi:hypothetical protein